MRIGLLLLLFIFHFSFCFAQSEKRWLKHQITTLSGQTMHGRGYVNKGVAKAANYLQRKYKEFGLLPFGNDSSYFQSFSFPVNTFPRTVYLKLQKKEMIPGEDYIIHAASNAYRTEKLALKKIDLKNVKDTAAWSEIKKEFRYDKAYLLKNADTLTKYLKYSVRSFAKELPMGLYIVPQHGKLTWTVATDTIAASVYYVEDTVMPKRMRKVAAHLENKFVPSFKSKNVLGFVPGTEKPDSFVVFTAHFDHLGKMGTATFPGAHDNASGTAVMLYMANYFARNPQKYSIAFMAFSGEEAGLIGSKYYVNNPVFPINNIRFVINLDMTGDATNGITVVNALEQKKAFGLLNEINEKSSYVPKINERDQSRNSDHYHFSEKGVPAIFIYGNGTKPYYHDVFDKASELSLENIDGLMKLLIEFAGKI
ncbi:MAG TPA: M28 family peptidase [Flavipsychrobacter sp.]|nr:M28 family peptidase [Flavipsychrobacter sp.]